MFFDGSYKAKTKGVSLSGKSAKQKGRDDLKERIKKQREERARVKKNTKAALVLQRCFRGILDLHHQRALQRAEFDALIEAKSQLLQQPYKLAYVTGLFVSFYDERVSSDATRLNLLCPVLLQSIQQQTASYLGLIEQQAAMWSGMVWQRQVVAVLSICVKASMLGKLPATTLSALLTSVTSTATWPAQLRKLDHEVTRLSLRICGVQNEQGNVGEGNNRAVALKDWIHKDGMSLFEAIQHLLAAEHSTINDNESTLFQLVQFSCKTLAYAEHQAESTGNTDHFSSTLKSFIINVAHKYHILFSTTFTAFILEGSDVRWGKCLQASIDALKSLSDTQVAGLLGNLLCLHNQREAQAPKLRTMFWSFAGKAFERVPNVIWQQKAMSIVPMEITTTSSLKFLVLRRREEGATNSREASESFSEDEVKRLLQLLVDGKWIQSEFYKSFDGDSWNGAKVLATALETLRNSSVIAGSTIDTIGTHVTRAVAFSRRDRPIISELWSQFLQHASPSKSFSITEAKIFSFCCASSISLFLVVDDDDLFVKGWPLNLGLLRRISQFTRDVLYRLVWTNGETDIMEVVRGFEEINREMAEAMKEQAIVLYDKLHERHTRHTIMPNAQWLFPAIPALELGLSQRTGVQSLEDQMDSDDSDDEAATRRKSIMTPAAASDRVKLIMRRIPQAIPFEQRLQVFQHYLAADKLSSGYYDSNARTYFNAMLKITVRRESLFEDAFTNLRGRMDAFRRTIQVKFVNHEGLDEAGIDGGGVFKEFIVEFMKQAFSPEVGLFRTTEDKRLYPDPDSTVEDKFLKYEFIGAMLAKAVYEGILVEPEIAPFFLNTLLEKTNTVHDLQSYDMEVYKSLMAVKNIDDPEELCLNFVAPSTGVPLCPNGESKVLTKDNRYEYIIRLANYLLNKRLQRQANVFKDGFNNLVPSQWTQLFSSKELQLLIGGSDKGYDVKELSRNVILGGGYFAEEPYLQLLWQVLDEFTPDEKSKFLHFITSCPRPPLAGFKSLVPKIGIQRVPIANDNERLPTASTCVNLLKLPTYSSKKVLKEKLLFSISQGAGFELS